MDKVKAIIKREYLTRVRSKGFIIGTILSPVLMLSFVVVPYFITRLGGSERHRVAILDQVGDPSLYQRVESLLVANGTRKERYDLERVEAPPDDDASLKRLQDRLATGEIDGYLILPPNILEIERLLYFVKNVGDFEARQQIGDAINRALVERRVRLAGLQSEDLQRLTREVRFEVRNERGERERGQTFILAFGLLMIIYITILVYGVMVMRGVIEEKQSRIIEVLLSSVRPFDLLLGKLIGIGLVGLTQYSVWTIFGLGLSLATSLPMLVANWGSLPTIQPHLLVFFLVYYVLGYFLYATLYAMVGAIVSNEEDGQQVQLPVTMAIIIPMMISTMVLRSPNSLTSTILSLVPFFSPMLMFLRIAIQTPPWWQIALSIVLLLMTILGTVWVSARIYRVGVLMYGKRPTLPEILRWLRYA
ncbi:MAG: ABC transporter permease [Blastocatellia bacterium]